MQAHFSYLNVCFFLPHSSVSLSLSLPPSLPSSLSLSVRPSLLFFSFYKLLTWVKNIQMKRSWRRPWPNIINLFLSSRSPHQPLLHFPLLLSHLSSGALVLFYPCQGDNLRISQLFTFWVRVFLLHVKFLLLLLLIFWADMKLLQNKCKLNFSCIICLEVLQHPKMRCDASIFLAWPPCPPPVYPHLNFDVLHEFRFFFRFLVSCFIRPSL